MDGASLLSVLTMYSGLSPAGDHREMIIWILPAVGGGEARLCGMVNVSEALINPVSGEELKLLVKALAKRHAIGSSAWQSGDADIQMAGEMTPPNPHMLSTRNWVSPYPRSRKGPNLSHTRTRQADRKEGCHRCG